MLPEQSEWGFYCSCYIQEGSFRLLDAYAALMPAYAEPSFRLVNDEVLLSLSPNCSNGSLLPHPFDQPHFAPGRLTRVTPSPHPFYNPSLAHCLWNIYRGAFPN